MHVRVMREPLSGTVPADFERYCTAGERLAVVDGDLWVHFTGQASESKLLGALTSIRPASNNRLARSIIPHHTTRIRWRDWIGDHDVESRFPYIS
ncbi:hypothetical protein D3C87_1535610 [compost metagenome]